MLRAFYQQYTKHIVCTRQDQGREHSILQYVTFMLDVYQVCHCVKYGSCSSSSIGVKVNGQYCWDILLCQQMLDATITSFITILSFSKAVQQSNCCSAKLSTSFLLSCGHITVQSLTLLTTRFRESYSSMNMSYE